MEPTNNNRVVVTDGEAKARKRRLAWACAGLALLDLILLLLLIFLPHNCGGRIRVGDDGYRDGRNIPGRTDTLVRDTVVYDTIHDLDTAPVQEEPIDTASITIDEAVEHAGGNVNGFLRFSIKWNQEVDLDAHAIEPTGAEIYYANYKKPDHTNAGGQLEIDRLSLEDGPLPWVENIYWPSADMLPNGKYRFFIHNYSSDETSRSCEAQLKVGNNIYHYRVGAIAPDDKVTIATVTITNHQMTGIQQSRYLVQ